MEIIFDKIQKNSMRDIARQILALYHIKVSRSIFQVSSMWGPRV